MNQHKSNKSEKWKICWKIRLQGKKKNHICDLLFLAKRQEYEWRISQCVHTILYYYSHVHTIW